MLTLAWLVPLFCHVFAYERQDYTVQARTEAGCAPRGTGRTVEIAPYLYSFRVTLDRFSDDQQWRAEYLAGSISVETELAMSTGSGVIVRLVSDTPISLDSIAWRACCSAEYTMHLFTDTELHLMTRMEEHTTLYCGAHSKSGAKRDCNLDSLGNPPEETRCPTVSRLLAYYDRTAQSYYTTITAGFFNNCPASTAPGIFSILLLASPNAQLAFELEVLPPIYDSTDWTVIASGPPGVKSIITHDRLSSVQPAVTVSLKIDFNERQQHYADWIECCQAWLTFSAEIDVLEQKMTIIPDSQKLEVYCATTSERDPMSGSSSKCSPAALGHPKAVTQCVGSINLGASSLKTM